MSQLSIALVAGVRFGTAEPHVGGMERHTVVLARALARAGHDVTVYAGSGSATAPADGSFGVEPVVDEPLAVTAAARADVSMPPELFMVEHDAYLDLCTRLADRHHDVVHNNSLHYLPVVTPLEAAVVHTLHTPPTPWLESAHRIRRRRRGPHRTAVVSVSEFNAAQWGGLADAVVPNGVDLDRWSAGPGGGGYAFWSGRLVPEKGPHLAIDAARRAGLPVYLAGPVLDPAYFDRCIAPRLGVDCVHVGHWTTTEIAHHLGRADVALVTPCWDEPFGLVVAEALACGTPVAAFGRGAMHELIEPGTGCIAEPGDVADLARAIAGARDMSRACCRAVAERRFSATVMARRYRSVYGETLDGVR